MDTTIQNTAPFNYAEVRALFIQLIAKNKLINPESKNLNKKESVAFEESLELVESILNKFGLPISEEYSSYFSNIRESIYIDGSINFLKEKAKEYLRSTPLSETTLLKEAIKYNYNAFDVLPELKITTHVYSLFIYYVVLLDERDAVQNVLKEFEIIKKSDDLLDLIGRISHTSDSVLKEQLYVEIKKSGLQYFDLYLKIGVH